MKLSSDYKEASSALKGVVMVGAVNAKGHQYLGGPGVSQPSRYSARTSPREPEVPRFVLENE